MSVQEFFDKASDLSLKALIVNGVLETIANQSHQALLHLILLGNLVPEIRRGVIAKDPKTPEEVLKYALLEESVCRRINPVYTNNTVSETPTQPPNIPCAAAYYSPPPW